MRIFLLTKVAVDIEDKTPAEMVMDDLIYAYSDNDTIVEKDEVIAERKAKELGLSIYPMTIVRKI